MPNLSREEHRSFMVDPLTRILKRIFLVVVIGCITVFVWGTVKTYQGSPPIPNQVVSSSGNVLFTRSDIIAGKAGFQEADLMDYGSVYGNGAYFGEDWTALLLHQTATGMMDQYAQAEYGRSYNELNKGQQVMVEDKVQQELPWWMWVLGLPEFPCSRMEF